jgi:hypothetical protein
MRNCQRTVSILLAILLLSEFALAKTNTSDWNNVRILEIGSRIVVKTKLGEKYEGTLELTTVNSLSIVVTVPRVMRRVIDLRKDEIKEVRTKLSRLTSTAIGAGIGLGVGIGLGAIADSKDKYGEDPGLGKITIGLVGVLLGSALGGGLGFGHKKIYEAP